MIPISLLQGNVVYDNGGDPYAVYIVGNVPYTFQNQNIKIAAIDKVARALYGYTGELYLYLLARQYSKDQIVEQMAVFSNTEGWRREIQFTYEHLKKELPYERVNYLVVPLKKRMALYYDQDKARYMKEIVTNVGSGIKDVVDNVKRAVSRTEITFTEKFLEHMQQQADDMWDKLSGFSDIRKATMRECEWWLKKGYHRGLADPELLLPEKFPTQVQTDSNETRRILPLRSSLFTLTKLTKEHMDFLESHTDEGISYSSYMPILHVPPEIDEINPTGFEWIYGTVERLSFPVDTALKFTIESSDDAKSKLKRRKKVVTAQIKEWLGGKQDVPEEVLEDLDGIDEVLRKFREKKMPMLYMTGVFAVGATSIAELNRRKKLLIDEAEQRTVITVNSPGDQQRMFQHFYPFAKKNLSDSWKIPMEPGTLGAGVPFGVRKLGDPIGFHFASLLGTNRPVFMNPKRPAMDKSLNRASTILIVGVPGSGKTATAKLILIMMVEWGAYAYVEDPKGDFDRFYEHPTISQNGRMVSFTPGSLTEFTPFRLSEKESERISAASTVMELLLNPAGSTVNEIRGFVIDHAMREMYKNSDKWDMYHFDKELENIEENHIKDTYRYEAEMCRGHLNKMRNKGIASLMFGEDRGVSLFDRRILIAITRDLVIPDRNKKFSEWTDDERISAALKYATSELGYQRLMSLPREVPKVLDLEEYWILKAFPGGKQLIEKAIRFSRYTNMTVILSTQNPSDPEEDENDATDDVTGLFSWKIVLRLDSLEQVASAVKLLGMTEERPRDWMQTFSVDYKNGKGLAKDPEGNIGEIQVMPLDPDLMYYLGSTPEEEQKGAEGA